MFLPLLLGLVTIVPALTVIRGMAIASGLESETEEVAKDDLLTAAQHGDLDGILRHLAGGADINAIDPTFGAIPLSWAALFGQTDAVALLLENGADINGRTKEGSTALHSAAFLGRAETAEFLLQHGAHTHLKNSSGATPAGSATVDWGITQYLVGLLRIKIDAEQVKAGRLAVIELLNQHQADAASAAELAAEVPTDLTEQIGKMITAPLFTVPAFYHLWFLWFLCWLVAAFAVYARVADGLQWRGPPSWLILSPLRFLWLVPLTMVPQWFMGIGLPSFGPDTSIGILPMPHILLYYAIFFGFGALYYDGKDDDARVGGGWRFGLPLGLVVFPLGLELSTGALGFSAGWLEKDTARLLGVALQVIYAWTISFAFIGLFREYFSGENYAVRYLSDSSYWLYVAHVPLIIGAQLIVRDWPLFSSVKFILICLVVTGFLLLVYQTLVRYRWLGKFLNGPRTRPTA